MLHQIEYSLVFDRPCDLLILAALSLAAQPQEIVSPQTTFLIGVIFIVPQSHMHSDKRPSPFDGNTRRTKSLLNFLPTTCCSRKNLRFLDILGALFFAFCTWHLFPLVRDVFSKVATLIVANSKLSAWNNFSIELMHYFHCFTFLRSCLVSLSLPYLERIRLS